MSATTPSNTPGAIETFSGRYVEPLSLASGDVWLDDIAHHLAQINRYNGAARRPISVAEHALLVCDRLASRGHHAKTCLAGLHHDDPEAYLHDICRPVKRLLGDDYARAETRALRKIWAALQLPDDGSVDWECIKEADDWALAAEAFYLLPSRGEGWRAQAAFDPTDANNPPRVALLAGDGLNWHSAKKHWLDAHYALEGLLNIESLGEWLVAKP